MVYGQRCVAQQHSGRIVQLEIGDYEAPADEREIAEVRQRLRDHLAAKMRERTSADRGCADWKGERRLLEIQLAQRQATGEYRTEVDHRPDPLRHNDFAIGGHHTRMIELND